MPNSIKTTNNGRYTVGIMVGNFARKVGTHV